MRISATLTKCGPQVVLMEQVIPKKKPRIATICTGCMKPIFENEKVFFFGSIITHNKQECVIKYIEPEEITAEEALMLRECL